MIFPIFNQIFIIARANFNSEMKEYLLHLVRNGEDGAIYRCLVLRADNQKLKVRDAWTWVHNNYNLRFGTQFSKDVLRKQFSYLRTKNRSKVVTEKEEKNKKLTKHLRSFGGSTARLEQGLGSIHPMRAERISLTRISCPLT